MKIDLNLWDAKSIKIVDNSIVIDTIEGRFTIVLPKEVVCNAFDWEADTVQEYLEGFSVKCNHPPIMHRLHGGCNAPECKCTLMRSDEEHTGELV